MAVNHGGGQQAASMSLFEQARLRDEQDELDRRREASEIRQEANRRLRERRKVEKVVSRLLRALLAPVPFTNDVRDAASRVHLPIPVGRGMPRRLSRLHSLCERDRPDRCRRLALAWMLLTGQPAVLAVRARWTEISPAGDRWTPAPVGHGVKHPGPIVLSTAAGSVLDRAREVGDGVGLALNALLQLKPGEACYLDKQRLAYHLDFPEQPERIFPCDIPGDDARRTRSILTKTLGQVGAPKQSLRDCANAFDRWFSTEPDCEGDQPLDAWSRAVRP